MIYIKKVTWQWNCKQKTIERKNKTGESDRNYELKGGELIPFPVPSPP